MSGIYLNDNESRITIAALQMLERELAAQLEETTTPPNPTPESMSPATRDLLDQHDAVSALTVRLANIGPHWVGQNGIHLATEGLQRYIDLLATSVKDDEVSEEEFLIDHNLQWCRMELANSSGLLTRLLLH